MPIVPYRVKEFETGSAKSGSPETSQENMMTWLVRQADEGYALHSVVAVKTFSGQDGVWAIVQYNPRGANDLSATA